MSTSNDALTMLAQSALHSENLPSNSQPSRTSAPAETSRTSKAQMSSLSLGDACLACRSGKKKCDGVQPVCGRCSRLGRVCEFTGLPARRRRTDILEERVLELQLRLAELSSTHDRILISNHLLEKFESLNISNLHRPVQDAFPLYPCASSISKTYVVRGEVFDEDMEQGYRPVIPRHDMEQVVKRWDLKTPISIGDVGYLSRIFLPFRLHYQFYMDTEYLVTMFNNKACHPCLLDAICLASCHIAGGRFTAFESMFLERARRQMYSCLENVDRLTHFLWASVILASYFRQNARLLEASTTIAAAVRFGIACGLPGLRRFQGEDESTPLLPPPSSQEEYDDGMRLGHALYMADRAFTACTGWSSSLPTIDRLPFYTHFKAGAIADHPPEGIEYGLWLSYKCGYGDYKIRAMVGLERVDRFARSVNKLSPPLTFFDTFKALASELDVIQGELPAITDPSGLDPLEHFARVNPNIGSAHLSYHGAVIILYSLAIGVSKEARRRNENSYLARSQKDDAIAYEKVFASASRLAELANLMRGSQGLTAIQCSLESGAHMLNAARIFARELKSSQLKKDLPRLASACQSLGYLVDFLHDLTGLHPKWAHILDTLRSLLPQSMVVFDP